MRDVRALCRSTRQTHEGQIYGPGATNGTGLAPDRVTLDMLRIAPARTNAPATHYLSQRKNKFGRRAAGVI
jgi:hypothetical protein